MIMKLPFTALILPLLAFSALHAADAPPVKYHRFEPLTPAEAHHASLRVFVTLPASWCDVFP